MKITNAEQLKTAYQALLILTNGDIKKKISHHAGIENLKREIRKFSK